MYKPAKDPNDLEKFFVERANSGDLDGLVALYERDAIVDLGNGVRAVGHEQIRERLADFLADHPVIEAGNQAPALICGDLALTSTRLSSGDVTAEVARRQPDGTWLWVADRFSLEL